MSLTLLTDSSLNSAVYDLRGIFICLSSCLTLILRHPWKTKSRGKLTTAWDVICRADCPNLGMGIDSFYILAAKTSLDVIDKLNPFSIFLVQLSDCMCQNTQSFEDRMITARTSRVFPGEGVHSEALADLVIRLENIGYNGDYSFEVFNDDYQQLPLQTVAQRARNSAL